MEDLPIVSKKTMAKLGSHSNDGVGSEMSDFARRQMEKMGWSHGKGLGKNEQGITTYVKVKKKEENSGIGVSTENIDQYKNQWWHNVYNNVANKIKVDSEDPDDDEKKKKKKKKKKKRKADKISKSDSVAPTDEELFAATGGRYFGRRAYGSCKGKLLRDQLQSTCVPTME